MVARKRRLRPQQPLAGARLCRFRPSVCSGPGVFGWSRRVLRTEPARLRRPASQTPESFPAAKRRRTGALIRRTAPSARLSAWCWWCSTLCLMRGLAPACRPGVLAWNGTGEESLGSEAQCWHRVTKALQIARNLSAATVLSGIPARRARAAAWMVLHLSGDWRFRPCPSGCPTPRTARSPLQRVAAIPPLSPVPGWRGSGIRVWTGGAPVRRRRMSAGGPAGSRRPLVQAVRQTGRTGADEGN